MGIQTYLVPHFCGWSTAWHIPYRRGADASLLQVEMRAWLGVDYVQGSICNKMPEQMRKDVEKLIAESQGSKTQPERFTRKEQAARGAARGVAGSVDESAGDIGSGPPSSRSGGADTPQQVLLLHYNPSLQQKAAGRVSGRTQHRSSAGLPLGMFSWIMKVQDKN